MGIPGNLQVDNAMCFWGSPRYPRGMGPLIRLCLHHGVEPWFIPQAEPWRNGVIEKFNDHYQQKFLNKVMMTIEADLKQGSVGFENKHNSSYRYSKLRGKTLVQVLAGANRTLAFPKKQQAPPHPLKKPEQGDITWSDTYAVIVASIFSAKYFWSLLNSSMNMLRLRSMSKSKN